MNRRVYSPWRGGRIEPLARSGSDIFGTLLDRLRHLGLLLPVHGLLGRQHDQEGVTHVHSGVLHGQTRRGILWHASGKRIFKVSELIKERQPR